MIARMAVPAFSGGAGKMNRARYWNSLPTLAISNLTSQRRWRSLRTYPGHVLP
jgi:hypothetical protein